MGPYEGSSLQQAFKSKQAKSFVESIKFRPAYSAE